MANLKTPEKKTKAQSMGMHTEVLTGKTSKSNMYTICKSMAK